MPNLMLNGLTANYILTDKMMVPLCHIYAIKSSLQLKLFVAIKLLLADDVVRV